MATIHIVYHHFPHYRRPVMRALAKSTEHVYRFFGGVTEHEGIKVFAGDDIVNIHPIGFGVHPTSGRMTMSDYRSVFREQPGGIIVIGNPNILATWLIAIEARLRGVRVAFWTHGWLRPERSLKRLIRNLYYGLANLVLVYGPRSKQLGIDSGYPAQRISVIFNSLDWNLQQLVYNKWIDVPRESLRAALDLPPHATIFASISRLTDICKYDWLLEGVASLGQESSNCIVLLIGDGPAEESLKALAERLGVALRLLGPLYDEDVIGRYLMSADAVVSPGKIGLTAMHSLAYGTPVVTHGNLDLQMPEVDAVIPGVSGELFQYADIDSLRSALNRIMCDPRTVHQRRSACLSLMQGRYTPTAQAKLIDRAMTEMTSGSN